MFTINCSYYAGNDPTWYNLFFGRFHPRRNLLTMKTHHARPPGTSSSRATISPSGQWKRTLWLVRGKWRKACSWHDNCMYNMLSYWWNSSWIHQFRRVCQTRGMPWIHGHLSRVYDCGPKQIEAWSWSKKIITSNNIPWKKNHQTTYHINPSRINWIVTQLHGWEELSSYPRTVHTMKFA